MKYTEAGRNAKTITVAYIRTCTESHAVRGKLALLSYLCKDIIQQRKSRDIFFNHMNGCFPPETADSEK